MPEDKNVYGQLSGHKECSKCGGSNDPISSNCRFCQTSLPRLDLDTLPEELLIRNCAIWLARLESLSEAETYNAAKALDANRKMGVFGKLLSFGSESEPGLSDIVASADRYVTILEGRSRYSSESADLVQRYKQRQERAVVAFTSGARRRKIINTVWIALLVSLFPAILIFLILDLNDEAAVKAERVRAESVRLEEIVGKVDQAIAKKDYNGARYFISQIKWVISEGAKEHGKIWDEKREGMVSALGKMSENAK